MDGLGGPKYPQQGPGGAPVKGLGEKIRKLETLFYNFAVNFT